MGHLAPWTARLIPGSLVKLSVAVSLDGGNRASACAFTYAVPPPPAPPTPESAPRDANALVGDASASVSWMVPSSRGSFPVTNYLGMSSPGGRTCLTTLLSCTVAGLSNGTAYTFTVKALTGAGWSELSAPSNAVTPAAESRPSITITGSRDGDRIALSGTATGFGMGGVVLVHFPLRSPGRTIGGRRSFRIGVQIGMPHEVEARSIRCRRRSAYPPPCRRRTWIGAAHR